MTINEAQAWINERHTAGARRIGVSCNPIRRIVYLRADSDSTTFECSSQRETRVIRDILHEYIGRLAK